MEKDDKECALMWNNTECADMGCKPIAVALSCKSYMKLGATSGSTTEENNFCPA